MIGFIPESTFSQATLMPTQVEDRCIRPPGRKGSQLLLVFSFTHSFQVSAGFLLLLGDGRGQCLASVFWVSPTQKGSGCSEPGHDWERPCPASCSAAPSPQSLAGASPGTFRHLQGLGPLLSLGTIDIVTWIIFVVGAVLCTVRCSLVASRFRPVVHTLLPMTPTM